MLRLTRTTPGDLEKIFLIQASEKGLQMAAFTAKDPFDKSAYLEKWTHIANNPDMNMQTLRYNGEIVGSILHFEMDDEMNVAYGIDEQHWGKGFATLGLKAFLECTVTRPLYGRVAFDNYASQKVLEKCGFAFIAEERGFANARNEEIAEFVYRLDG